MFANRCPSCDYDEIDPEESHCPSCGHRLSEPNRIWFWAIAALTMGGLITLVIWAVPSGSGSSGRPVEHAPAVTPAAPDPAVAPAAPDPAVTPAPDPAVAPAAPDPAVTPAPDQPVTPAPNPADTGNPPASSRELVERILPGVVSVQVPGANSQGSGWVWDTQGRIVTNAHVVQDAGQATIVTSSGEQLLGQVLGVDRKWDIAVIQVEGSDSLRPLPLGQSAGVRPGDEVMAFGSPLGLENTVTDGLISALRTDIRVESAELGKVFQTSAAIAPGSSGGPLVERAGGTVIGVNTAAVRAETASNIGFAVPIDEVKSVVERILQ